MTHATEKVLAGRKPCFLCEMDLDYCSRYHPGVKDITASYANDSVDSYNRNVITQTEEHDGVDWVQTAVTVSAGVSTPPDGSETAYTLTDNNAGTIGRHGNAGIVPSFTGNSIYFWICKAGTSTQTTLEINDTTVGTNRFYVDYGWAGGVPSVSAITTGSNAGVEDLGGGWYVLYGETTSITAANAHRARIYPDSSAAAGTGSVEVAGCMWHSGTTRLEYEYEDARDGTSTNILLTTGGLSGYNDFQNLKALIGSNLYTIERNYTEYIRVAGDASGEGASADVTLFVCTATVTNEPCYNTYATCQAPDDYTISTLTYKFTQPRENIPGSSGYISSLRNVSIESPKISRGDGVSVRGSVSMRFVDHLHHDRGIDLYVDGRSYTPENQGTFWGKLLARNPNYQNRVCRVKTGYISDSGFDATNDFLTRTYLLDKISGPTAKGEVSIKCKDALSPAANKRSQVPVANTGTLTGAYTSGDGSFTLSPTGIGNTEYSASGVIRIGEELMTFTRAGDTVTVTGEGQYNTTAANHSAGDTVQECLVYSAARIDDVLYALLVTYGNVNSAYITFADWTSEVDTWLASSTATTVISEPTGVWELVNEILEQYMIDLWWDDINAKIKLQVLRPPDGTPDTIDDDDYILKDSFAKSDVPEDRLSRVWVFHSRYNPTINLDENTNYRVIDATVDASAESVNEYNEVRVKKIYSRWLTSSADAARLATRLVSAYRDNPRHYRFRMDAAQSYTVGDYVTLDTSSHQDPDGSNKQQTVFILAASETMDGVGGSTYAFEAIDSAFNQRYARIAPNGTADYTSASVAEQNRYGWISATATEEMSNGDMGYYII